MPKLSQYSGCAWAILVRYKYILIGNSISLLLLYAIILVRLWIFGVVTTPSPYYYGLNTIKKNIIKKET